MSTDNTDIKVPVKIICPSTDELSVIINQVQCSLCHTTFKNQSNLTMHDLKVHKQQNLDKSCKENIQYHCPVENCVYSVEKQRYFKLYKYLKQHYLKVHAEKQFACDNCTKSFSTNAAKEAHVKICGTKFICECQKVYSSYEALLTHAKRKSHKVHPKYKSTRLKDKAVHYKLLPTNLFYILPKSTCDASIQTEEIEIKSKSPKNKNPKKQVCRQTQTNNTLKEKQVKKSAETQTTKAIPRLIRVHKVAKRKKISEDKKSVSREEISLHETLSSEYLLPDIILQDIWEEPVKNIFTYTSGTQTSPEKDIFGASEDQSRQDPMYHRLSKSDPMLTEKIYTDKFNSIETQTEEEYCRSIFESDPLSSNNETQTTESFTEAIEPLIYNDTYTQTCDEIFSSVLSDIQTQTAWSHLTEISTDSQTKVLKCSNMETQTTHDLFEDLR